jgi:tetratricopeptide (TPR) repeat protein
VVEDGNRSVKQTPSASGALARTPLVHLIVYALDKQLTGSIELVTPAQQKAALYLRSGRIVKAKSFEPVSFLGQVLVDQGVLSDERLRESLFEVARAKRLHGQVLLDRGWVTDAQLAAALREHVMRTLQHFCSLPAESTYAFYADVDLLETFGGDEWPPVDPYPVVWRTLLAAPPSQHMALTLAQAHGRRFVLRADAPVDRFEFAKDVAAGVELLRGRGLSVDEFVAASALLPEIAQRAMYALIITKQLALASADHARASLPPPASSASAPPSSFVTPPVASPEVAERRRQLNEARALLSEPDHYAVLGASRDATAHTIQKCFVERARVVHPDKLPPELSDQKDLCARIFSRVAEANAVLSDPARRRAYDEQLQRGSAVGDDEQAQVARVLDAAAAFQRAEVCLKRNDFAQAESFARDALANDPQPEYLTMVAWLESLKPDRQDPTATRACIAQLDDAIRHNDRLERAFFYRALLHKKVGAMPLALKDFQRALELSPGNLDAARELRIHEMRSKRASTAASDAPPNTRRSPYSVPPPAEASRPGVAPKSVPRAGGLLDKLFKR